jgi:EAL domain-containing protein (putative c-di-GMP-specific phosphodiesterase class I)
VRAIAGLATALGISTTAEGVETAEEMHHVRSEGCTDIQGYLISKPVPASELPALFARQANAA